MDPIYLEDEEFNSLLTGYADQLYNDMQQPQEDTGYFMNTLAAIPETIGAAIPEAFGSIIEYASQPRRAAALQNILMPWKEADKALVRNGQGDFKYADPNASTQNPVSDMLQDIAQTTREYTEEVIPPSQSFGPSLVRGALPLVGTAMATTAATGNPWLGLLAMTGQQFSNRYQSYKNQGVDLTKAGDSAAAMAPVDALFNAIVPGSSSFGPLVKYAVAPAVNSAANYAQEMFIEQPFEEYVTGREISPEESAQRGTSAAVVGGVLPAAINVSGALGGRGRYAKQTADNYDTIDINKLINKMDEAEAITPQAEVLRLGFDEPLAMAEPARPLGLPAPEKVYTSGDKPGQVVGEAYVPKLAEPEKRPYYEPITIDIKPDTIENPWLIKVDRPGEPSRTVDVLRATAAEQADKTLRPVTDTDIEANKQIRIEAKRAADKEQVKGFAELDPEGIEAAKLWRMPEDIPPRPGFEKAEQLKRIDALKKKLQIKQTWKSKPREIVSLDPAVQLAHSSKVGLGVDKAEAIIKVAKDNPVLAQRGLEFAERKMSRTPKAISRYVNTLQSEAQTASKLGIVGSPDEFLANTKLTRMVEEKADYHAAIEGALTKRTAMQQLDLAKAGNDPQAQKVSLSADIASRLLEAPDNFPAVKKLLDDTFKPGMRYNKKAMKTRATEVAAKLENAVSGVLEKQGIEASIKKVSSALTKTNILDDESGGFMDTVMMERLAKVFEAQPKNKVSPTWEPKIKTPGKNYIEPSEAFERGMFTDQQQRIGRDNIRAFNRRVLTLPTTLAKKFPKTYGVFKGELDKVSRTSAANIYALSASAKQYFELPKQSQKIVNDALIAARYKGSSFAASTENFMRIGLSLDEAKAAMSVRNSMNQALDIQGQSLKDGRPAESFGKPELKQAWDALIDQGIDAMRTENYVPFSRFGKYYVVADGANQAREVRFTRTEKEALDLHEKFLKQNRNSEYGAIVTSAKAVDDLDLPPELVMKLAQFNPDILNVLKEQFGIAVEGYQKHLLHAKLVPGFNPDLQESIAKYIQEVSDYSANKLHGPAIRKAIQNISPEKEPSLHKAAKDLYEFTQTDTSEAALFKQVATLGYLAGVLKSSVVNLTGPLQMTYPQLARYVKNPGAVFSKSLVDAGAYLANKKVFQNSNPELHAAMDRATREGIISDAEMRKLYALQPKHSKAKSALDTVTNAAMWGFSKVETFNRTNAFLAGWEAFKDKPFNERYDLAADFINETQGQYGKENRPVAMRGPVGAAAGTFRMYSATYLAALRRNMTEGEWGAVMRSLGATAALGGATGTIVSKIALELVEAAGVDVDKELRELVGEKGTNFILRGPLTLLGFDISGPIDQINYDINSEQGVVAGVVKAIGGIPVDMVDRVFNKFPRTLEQSDSFLRASETLVPEAIRNAMVAARPSWDGGAWKSPSGTVLVENPTMMDRGKKFFGFTPPSLTNAYDREEARMSDRNRGKANYNREIGEALAEGNVQKARELAQRWKQEYAKAKPENRPPMINESAILSAILKRKNPKAYEILRARKDLRPYIAHREALYDPENEN